MTGRNSVPARLRNKSSDLEVWESKYPSPPSTVILCIRRFTADNPLKQDVHPLGPVPGWHQSACCLLRAWGNNRRGQNCKLQLVAEAGKKIVLMFVHRWRGGAKWLTSRGGGGGGGGFGRTPRTPPGSAPESVLPTYVSSLPKPHQPFYWFQILHIHGYMCNSEQPQYDTVAYTDSKVQYTLYPRISRVWSRWMSHNECRSTGDATGRSTWTTWLRRISQRLRSAHADVQLSSLCDVNDTRALISLGLLVRPHWDEVRRHLG